MKRLGAVLGAAALVAIVVAGIPPAMAGSKASLPAITKVDPPSGPLDGGISVTISGVAFTGVTEVDFGAASAGYSFVNDTTVVAVSPAGAAGTVDVRVTTPAGTSAVSGSDKFTYQDVPTVSSLAPISGPLGGGTAVTITGTNFVGATGVKFGSVAVDPGSITVEDATHISVVSPLITQAGAVDVRVTTTSGTSAVVDADSFTYQEAPLILSLDPPSGPTAGGTIVKITGENFVGASEVDFGPTVIPPSGFVVDSPTQITLTSPAGSGKADVTVTTPSGVSLPATFSYQGAPKVTKVSPASGPTKGGTKVTLTGQNFIGTSKVSFGSKDGTKVTVVSGTELTVVSPKGSVGTVDVRVTSPSGQSGKVSADHFTYQGAPTVTSLSPTFGPLAGGTTVTITGTNLLGATAVKFGSSAATSFTVVSSTKITAVSPSGTGTIHITVTTAAGTSATSSSNDFIYSSGTPSGGVNTGAGGAAGGGIPWPALALVLAGLAGLATLRIRARRA